MPKSLIAVDNGQSRDSHLGRTDAKTIGLARKVAELARLGPLGHSCGVAFAAAADPSRNIAPIHRGLNRRRVSSHMSVSSTAIRGAVNLCLG